MTQEERWMAKYEEVVGFIKANHRNPSKYNLEQRDMYNWLKATRKKMNAGELKADRVEKYEEVVGFIKESHRNPSRHRIEEHDMLNWVKANRKVMNAGELAEPRFSQFVELLELCNMYKHINQWI